MFHGTCIHMSTVHRPSHMTLYAKQPQILKHIYTQMVLLLFIPSLFYPPSCPWFAFCAPNFWLQKTILNVNVNLLSPIQFSNSNRYACFWLCNISVYWYHIQIHHPSTSSMELEFSKVSLVTIVSVIISDLHSGKYNCCTHLICKFHGTCGCAK